MENTFVPEASLNSLALAFLFGMAALTLFVARPHALIPLLITTCYMPLGQAFVIGGVHLQFFRILLLVGWARVLSRGEHRELELTRMDRLFLYWAAATVVLGTLASPGLDRLIRCSGAAFDALGTYFLMRCWIRSFEDFIGGLRFLGVMVVPLAVCMIAEKFTGRNVFSVFGGVSAITGVREGRLRCQGAFRHPILAGTYAATLFPLFIGLLISGRRNRWPALLGICSTLIACLAATSSGALLALMSAVAGFALWPLRFSMRLLRRGAVAIIIGLALVMNAPVWYLIARVADITGGTGWHRSYLIDVAIKHFGEWCLFGTVYTAHWAPAGQVLAADPDNMDITNHYIAEGIGGGMVKLGLFLAMIVLGFKVVGRWIRRTEPDLVQYRFLVWAVGVCLCAHCVSFISILYFDQIIVMWFWILAIIAMISFEYDRAAELSPEPQTTEAGEPAQPFIAHDFHGAQPVFSEPNPPQ